MPAIVITILGLFARPLGQLITQGLTAASAAFVTWAVAKGLPLDTASSIAAAVVGVISTLIGSLAASQGVNIPVINADATNNVKVVPASSPTPAVNSPGK